MTAGSAAHARVGSRTAQALIVFIEAYRHMISPLRLPSCRFMPTCSQYAVDALTEYGLLRGGLLALRRLGRCGPWHGGGWDPIPERVLECGDCPHPEVRSTHV